MIVNNRRDTSVGRETGLLSDIQILERLVAADPACIFITPLVNPERQVGPSSLDVHLGGDLRVTRTVGTTHLDLASSRDELEQGVNEYFERREVGTEGRFVLHPGEFALASTLEFFKLPEDIAGRLEGRSSFGRLGLQIHATAGFVEPGFSGCLTFELINSGKLPVVLRPGIRLGQMCFLRVEEVQVDYRHKPHRKYSGSLDVTLSRVHLDPETPVG